MDKPIAFQEVPEPMEERAGELRRWTSRLKRVHSMARPLVSSVHYCLPLAFLQFSHDSLRSDAMDEVDPISLQEVLEEILLMVDIKGRDEKTVRHVAAPNYTAVKGYYAARSMIMFGRRALYGVYVEIRDDTVFHDLKTLGRVVQEYLESPLQMVAEQEVSRVLKVLSEECSSEKSNELDCEEHLRNFIAHSGLSKKLLECTLREEVLLGYREDCIERVRRLASRALRRGDT